MPSTWAASMRDGEEGCEELVELTSRVEQFPQKRPEDALPDGVANGCVPSPAMKGVWQQCTGWCTKGLGADGTSGAAPGIFGLQPPAQGRNDDAQRVWEWTGPQALHWAARISNPAQYQNRAISTQYTGP